MDFADLVPEFREALISAFPIDGDIGLVAANAGQAVAETWAGIRPPASPSMPYAVNQLVTWAAAQEYLSSLLKAALKKGGRNLKLKAVADKLAPLLEGLSSVGLPFGEAESKLFGGKSFQDAGLWIEKLASVRRSICRIEYRPQGSGVVFGTGFLVGAEYVLTNDHVAKHFWSTTDLGAVTCRFDYETGADGKPIGGESINPRGDWTMPRSDEGQLDFAVIRLNRPALTNSAGLRRLPLRLDHDGTIDENEPLLILQHPGGRPLQLAFGSLDRKSEDNHFYYKVETEHGSSGSPVLNSNLEVVAIHHYGLMVRNRGVRISKIVPTLASLLAVSEKTGQPESAIAEGLAKQADEETIDEFHRAYVEELKRKIAQAVSNALLTDLLAEALGLPKDAVGIEVATVLVNPAEKDRSMDGLLTIANILAPRKDIEPVAADAIATISRLFMAAMLEAATVKRIRRLLKERKPGQYISVEALTRTYVAALLCAADGRPPAFEATGKSGDPFQGEAEIRVQPPAEKGILGDVLGEFERELRRKLGIADAFPGDQYIELALVRASEKHKRTHYVVHDGKSLPGVTIEAISKRFGKLCVLELKSNPEGSEFDLVMFIQDIERLVSKGPAS